MKTIEEKERLNKLYGKISAAGPEDDTLVEGEDDTLVEGEDELGGLDPESNDDDEEPIVRGDDEEPIDENIEDEA